MHFDILILGYGPVAAVAVNMLGQRGWRVAVIDRMPDVYPLPRAIFFDGETFRTFQELGLDSEIGETTAGGQGAEFLDADGNRLSEFYGKMPQALPR
jgi:3-(3-hydroxy-phenyl)propionate hydroxylase